MRDLQFIVGGLSMLVGSFSFGRMIKFWMLNDADRAGAAAAGVGASVCGFLMFLVFVR